jgi:hypothetical protein
MSDTTTLYKLVVVSPRFARSVSLVRDAQRPDALDGYILTPTGRAVLVEVLFPRTRRTDEGEKKDAYLTIPALSAYVLVEQATATAVVFRRTEHGFVSELYQGLEAVIPLGEIDVELALAEVYDGVDFTPEPTEDETA